jgi:hypothetical protein
LTVTHPFHPLSGQEFELLDHRHNWGEDRVTVAAADGNTFSLPTCWTSVSPVDPAVAIAEGRLAFRLADLSRLADLVAELTQASATPGRVGEARGTVRKIMP